MDDYISREAAIRFFDGWADDLDKQINDSVNYPHLRSDYKVCKTQLLDCIHAIKEMPAADVVEVVRCKDCIHAPLPGDCEGDMEWPKIDGIYEDCTCPHFCDDNWYSARPDPDGFCENGERREPNLDTTKGDNHD